MECSVLNILLDQVLLKLKNWPIRREIIIYDQKMLVMGKEDLDHSDTEQAFDTWLERLLKPRFPDVDIYQVRNRGGRTMLAESLDQWIAQSRRKGLLEGRREGRREGRKEGVQALRELVIDLLKQRFETLPPEIDQRVHSMRSISRLSKLAKDILTAERPDDLELA